MFNGRAASLSFLSDMFKRKDVVVVKFWI